MYSKNNPLTTVTGPELPIGMHTDEVGVAILETSAATPTTSKSPRGSNGELAGIPGSNLSFLAAGGVSAADCE